MDDLKALMLSITEKYDKEKRKPLTSQIEVEPRFKVKTIDELSKEEEEKQFYQEFISIFIVNKKMSQTKIDKRLFLDIRDTDFLIRKPFDATTWALYKKGNFLVRVTMLNKDKYKFKIPVNVIKNIKFTEESYNILKNVVSVDSYVSIILGYKDSLLVLNNFRTISKNKQNDLLD